MTAEIKLKETIDTYDKSAERYQDKFMDMDLYNDTFDKFCSLIQKESAEVLEIGVGPGNVTKYLTSQRPDLKIFGIDMAPKMIELAQKNNPEPEFEVMDCKEIHKLNRKFDAIMCGFCMPYLSKEECKKLIADSSNLLTKDGLLYLSTMEGDYDNSGYETTSFSGQDRVYIYYHQVDYLTDCLTKNGFEIVDLQRKKYPEPDGSYLTDIIIIATKH